MRAIHILSPELTMIGEIANYTSLRLQRRFRDVGDFEMVLSLHHPMAERLARDQILCPAGQAHKAMLIEEITKAEGADTVSVKGYTLSGILRRRVCIPPAQAEETYGYDRIISDAESVMRHYVYNNLIAPQSSARMMDCMELESENGHRGMANVPWSARFEQLDAVLASIGAYTDSGFSIVPDFEKRKLVFTYLPGRDMTGATNGRRVTFGVHMGNVMDTATTESAQQAKNTAIVGGAGEDENRMILSVSPAGEAGIYRREMFVDAGSLDDAQEIVQEGERRLAEKKTTLTIRAQVMDTPSCRYGEDWELGDLVTVVARGVQMNARITQVQESHEAGRAPRIEATFGEPLSGIERILKDKTRIAVR